MMDKLSMYELHLILCTNVRLARIGLLVVRYVREGYFALLVKHHTVVFDNGECKMWWNIGTHQVALMKQKTMIGVLLKDLAGC